MLKRVFIIEKTKDEHSDAVVSEMRRAAESLRQEGFISSIVPACSAEEAIDAVRVNSAASGTEDTLFLCTDSELLSELLQAGACAIGYSHADNPGERFPGAPYIVQEPDLVDADSYVKMYERAAGLPWTILETERCFVREFTAEDLDGIYALYDEEARRFLEPPSRDRAHELAILRAYIDRVYGLYGFGHWAVFLKEDPETLVGRVGYSAITSRQEREAQALNTACPDADFGFLILGDRRGKGIAGEVCRALLRYGFSELGFSCIRADARNDNAASIRLLKKLGFVPVGSCLPEKSGEQGDKTLFILNLKDV